MDNSFYLYLPSDGCPRIHPENTQHHYQITLDTGIVFPSEDWEVALKEISYMNVFKIFTHGEHFEIRKFTNEQFKLRTTIEYIHPDYWKSPGGLVEVNKKDFKWIAEMPNGTAAFTIEYNASQDRMQFTSYLQESFARVRISYFMAAWLGFVGFSAISIHDDKAIGHMVNIIGDNIPFKPIIAPNEPSETLYFSTDSINPRYLRAEVGNMEKDVIIRRVTPQAGYYDSVETLVEELNLRTWETVSNDSNLKDDYKQVIHEKNMFHFEKHTGRIVMVVPNKWAIEFKNGMEKILGFTQSIYGTTVIATLAPSLHSKIYSIYLHLNIIDVRRVGHQKLQLLRSIPRSPMEVGEVVTVTFENLHYCSLNTNYIHMIEIKLMDDSGHPVQFEEGKTLVVLHFRRRHPHPSIL